MVQSQLKLYQARFKRKFKNLLDGREVNLQDSDIRYLIAEDSANAQINAEQLRKTIEYELNANGHQSKYSVSTASVRPIHIAGYKIRIEKIVSDNAAKVKPLLNN